MKKLAVNTITLTSLKSFFWRLFKGKFAMIVITILSYLVFIAYYMGPSSLQCGTTVYGFGDSTAGQIWHYSFTDLPIGGRVDVTNYPYGEDLYNPTLVSVFLQQSLHWGMSKLVGPVCGFSLVNIVGFLSAALTMFAFVYYLIRKGWIAWLAGFTAAFTPYFQTKVGGHPGYGYSALLLGCFWLTLHVIKKQKYIHAIFLSLILAVCAFFDPYFILLAATIMLPLSIVWFILSAIKIRHNKAELVTTLKTAKLLLLSLGLFIVLISPLLTIRIRDANSIAEYTASRSESVLAVAQMCSNLPQDYILPDPKNIYLVKVFGPSYPERIQRVKNWCNSAESRVSISLLVMGVILLGTVILAWEKLHLRRLYLHRDLHYNPELLIGSLLAIGICAFLIGLPPYILGYLMPSGYIIKITDTWRVFAREYLVLNLVVVILFSIFLNYFAEAFRKRHKPLHKILVPVIFIIIFAEYQVTPVFQPGTFNYKKDVPTLYYDIKNDASIQTIAEYPLDRPGIESDAMVYYLTMQTIHRKKLLNSAILGETEKIHIGLKDLTDPQTIPALRQLGIQYVIVHGLSLDEIKSKTNQLEIIKHEIPPVWGLNVVKRSSRNDIVLAKIVEGPKLNRVLTLDKGFVINLLIMKDSLNVEFEMIQNAELTVTKLLENDTDLTQPICFEAKMSAEQDVDELSLIINGQIVKTQLLNDNYSQIKLDVRNSDVIVLRTKEGHNIRLNNLGCGV